MTGNRYLCIDADHRFITVDGRPFTTPDRPHGGEAVRVNATLWAVRVPAEFIVEQARDSGGEIAEGLQFATNPRLARALALLRHRDSFRFDPADGRPLSFDEDGIVARGHGRQPIFPRIDPAVIGIVELAGQERILLGRNVRREFFSLIAGYVDPGETLEDAFTREVLEETGRRINRITYRGSQPWPASGSLMVGFHAFTTDVDATAATDGELAETRWVARHEIDDLPLARPGSIAHTLITEWRDKR